MVDRDRAFSEPQEDMIWFPIVVFDGWCCFLGGPLLTCQRTVLTPPGWSGSMVPSLSANARGRTRQLPVPDVIQGVAKCGAV